MIRWPLLYRSPVAQWEGLDLYAEDLLFYSSQTKTLLFSRENLIPGSSMVERATVNRYVVGSNPTRGATVFVIFFCRLCLCDQRLKRKSFGFVYLLGK
jgi:hypothetical protein